MAPVQHYVPQFLLRNFCAGAKPKIWAFDKNTGKSFETNVRNIAGEREFYDLSVGDATLSLEEGLDALLRRLRHTLLELGVEVRRLLPLGDLDPEREATGLDNRAQVREARLLRADLPACHLGPLAPQASYIGTASDLINGKG